MQKKSKVVQSCKEDFENKLRIEKWMKRNTSGRVSIGQNIIKLDNSNKNSMQFSNVKYLPSDKIELNVSKIKLLRSDQGTTSIDVLNKKPSEVKKKRHLNNFLSDEVKYNVLKRKISKNSIPAESSEIELVKLSNTNSLSKQSNSANKTKIIASKISKNSCNIEWVNNSMDDMKVNQKINGKSPPVMQNSALELPSITQGNQNLESDICSKNSLKNLLCKETDVDVYTSLLENYRYLITPKSWSVTEFTSETKNRYVVFFNVHVIKENDILISVMRKSLIIDKGAAINYSVHGLPVDINGTILPKTLDNTKKLLSILHIFDKMQVCDGLGSDLNIMQTDFVFKDNCRYWRHKHCKVILIKAMRCLICTETRNLLLQRKAIFKEEMGNSLEFKSMTKN